MAARQATRSSLNVFKLWATDSGTFPIVFIASGAAVAATACSIRYLTTHPDVCINKTKRETSMHYDSQTGADWRARRFRMANLKRNPINQSRQFDDLFAKEANQNVQR